MVNIPPSDCLRLVRGGTGGGSEDEAMLGIGLMCDYSSTVKQLLLFRQAEGEAPARVP